MTTPHRPRAGSAAGYLRPIASGLLTSPREITRALTNALGAADYSDCVKDLRRVGIDPQSYINGLDKVCPSFIPLPVTVHSRPSGYQAIDILSHESDIHERCVRALSKVCGIYGLLPDSHEVGLNLTVGDHPVTFGGFSDIWKAAGTNGEVWAIKMLRVYQNDIERMKKVGRCARFLACRRRISDQTAIRNSRNTAEKLLYRNG